MRDLLGYHETRLKLLTLKSAQGNNWLAYAMSAHLLGNYEESAMILDIYDKTKRAEIGTGFEHSEVLLYKNQVLEESGKFVEALAHLQSVERYVIDKLAWREKQASLLSRTERHADAEAAYRVLLQANPENRNYHRGLIAAKLAVPCPDRYEELCRNLSDGQQATLEALYVDLVKEHPRSLLARRVPLEFLHGDKFQAAFSAYIRPNLRKGVPSLFIGLKALYSDQAKKDIIGKVVDECVESLTKNRVFPFGEDGLTNAQPEKEPPSSFLWLLYFAAQHYDKLDDHQKAIELIDSAISHTPTVIELYTLKAKVLKHAGNVTAAWNTYERARELDLADRYLNTKATLYALRADHVEAAERTIALFTKEGADSQDVLYDMQCMWYETESAASYLRTGNHGRALKKLVAVEKHFEDIVEDQFDFHTYCLRKMTLRAYLSLLRLEDKLYGLRYYRIAAKGIVNTYLDIFDHPHSATNESSERNKGLSAKEKKKFAKQKFAAKKETPAASAASAASPPPSKPTSAAVPSKTDEDADGAKLANVPDPLERAYKYLSKLLKYSPNDVEVQLLACRLNLRRHKCLQVVQALNRAIQLAPDHSEIHKYTLELGLAVAELKNDDTVTSLLREHSTRLLQGKTPLQANEEFISTLTNRTYAHRRIAAESLLKLEPHRKLDAASLLLDADFHNASLKEVQDAFIFVSTASGSEEVTEQFRAKSHSLFPLAALFSPAPTPESEPSTTPTSPDTSDLSSSTTTTFDTPDLPTNSGGL